MDGKLHVSVSACSVSRPKWVWTQWSRSTLGGTGEVGPSTGVPISRGLSRNVIVNQGLIGTDGGATDRTHFHYSTVAVVAKIGVKRQNGSFLG